MGIENIKGLDKAIEIDKENNKKQFRVYWLEYHNPLNWDKDRPAKINEIYANWEKATTKERDLVYKYENGAIERGIKQLYDLLPAKDIHPDPLENDGWVECECEDTFEAGSIEKAIKYVEENYEIQSGVFTIFDKENYIVATEEGIEIPKRKGNIK